MNKISLMLMLFLAATSANAAKFGVKVVSESGKPIAGAAVCIGTHGNYRQFIAEFTSANGEVSVEVPNVPLVVTVSRDRFSGIRMAEPARKFNLIKEVKLLDDVPGPRCRAGSTLAEKSDNGMDGVNKIGVDDIFVQARTLKADVAQDASDVAPGLSLIPSVTGYPSHYRLSDSMSFDESSWVEYQAAIDLPERLHDKKSVFMQVRRLLTQKTGWIEARSDVVSVELPTL